jgi:multiple sugar transport system substrate-binding protein
VLKRLTISLLAIAAAALLVWGPRPEQSLPAGRVVVDYWEKWGGAEEAAMRQIVDDFNATVGAQKRIYVRYVSTSTINTKTLAATAAGVPPDIAGLFDRNLVQFAAMGALEPLDDLAAAHGITRSYYKPVYWDGCNYGGHLWGLVSTPTVVALFYNKRIFAEQAAALRAAGVDPTQPPGTIAQLDRYAAALTVRDAAGRIVRAGFLPTEPTWYDYELCYWFGGGFWDAGRGKFTLTAAPVVAAYQWIASYSRRLGKDAVSDFSNGVGTFNSPQNAFLTGAVAAEMQGVFLANFILKNNPAMSSVRWSKQVEMTKPPAERAENYDWAAAPFPSTQPGREVALCGYDVLAIPHGARHKQEAFEFIAYVNRQDVSEKLCKLHCKNSPLARVSEDFLDHHPNPYIRMFERLASGPGAVGPPQIPIMPEVVDELVSLGQQVSLLQAEPAAALAAVQTRLQAKYDSFAARQRMRGGNWANVN